MTEIIPNFEDMQVVDKDGNFTPTWKNIMSSLVTFLQKNHSQEGLVSPQQTTSNINTLSTVRSVGSMIYNTDTNQYEICSLTSPTTAEFRTITTSKIVTI
jgi:hypothetical protein